jgi:RNase P subunit RPR2
MSEVACHDRTPFIDYTCSACGFIMHIHESQLPTSYRLMEIRTFCKGCGAELILPTPTFRIVEGGDQ